MPRATSSRLVPGGRGPWTGRSSKVRATLARGTAAGSTGGAPAARTSRTGAITRTSSVEPEELPGQGYRLEVAPHPRGEAVGPGGLDGVVAPHGHGERQPVARVLLAIVLPRPVHGGAAAPVEGRVARDPETGLEGVADVELERAEGTLLAPRAPEEIGVVREEPDPRVELEHPPSPRVREPELRLEGPAIGPEVDELGRVVLAVGGDDHEAPSERRAGNPGRELHRGERGSPEDVGGQAQPEVGEPGPADRPMLFRDLARDPPPHVGEGEGGARGSSRDPERPAVRQAAGVDVRLHVAEGQGGVEDHVARGAPVEEDGEVRTGGAGRVGSGLELLAAQRRRPRDE